MRQSLTEYELVVCPNPFNVVTAVKSKTLWSAKVYWSLLTALDYRRDARMGQLLLSRRY